MKRLLTIFAILFGCLCAGVKAQTDVQIKEKINGVASKMKTMQCDFVQTKNLKMLNDKLVSKGKMYYQQGNRLRWEYQTPYSYVFILNDNKVLLKNQKRNDVIDVQQNKIFKEIARIMMNSVVGKCLSDDKDFNVSIVVASTEWVATLLPQKKDMKQMFQKIILHVDSKASMVSKVELVEKNGDNTVIELKNVKTNATIDASLFAVN